MGEHHIVVPRTARYHTLGGDGEPVKEVWFVCHGFGQLAGEFIREFEGVATPDRLVVAPEALNRYYLDEIEKRRDTPGRVGATWMTREDRLHEIDDYVGYLDRLAEHVLGPLDGVPRVRALGFSQGAATVCRWVTRGSARVDDLTIWAGAIPPELDPASSAARLREVRLTIVLGTRDQYASWAAAEQQAALLAEHGIEPTLISFAGGHRMDRGVLERLATAGG